uniref:Uncharacterized protein n=1 Tax=Mycena chlorophos TaxID=658473 RepID=A0ABQ0L654_MYCCL|nr:predicted protein [Mycena chlorophos]
MSATESFDDRPYFKEYLAPPAVGGGAIDRSSSVNDVDNGPEYPSQNIEIKVFVKDRRSAGNEPVSQRLTVTATEQGFEFPEAAWNVKLTDLFTALQESPARLGGVGKLMFRDPDELDEEFWIVLVCFSSRNPPIYSPQHEFLAVSEDRKLHLRVVPDEETPTSPKGKRRAVSEPETDHSEPSTDLDTAGSDAETYPLVRARKRAKKAERKLSQDIQKLQKKISKLPGYSDFTKARGARKIKNAQAVLYWKFIATTTAKFMGEKTPKKAICEALKIKEGTHRTGMIATKILDEHASDNGVAQRMKTEDGSVALFKFLEGLGKVEA